MANRLKLTEKRIRALERDSEGSDRYLRDSELIGFGVRVKAKSGTRSYFIEYRTASGRNRRMVLGLVGRLRLEDARSIAQQHIAAVARGEDPLSERQAARHPRLLADIAEHYLEEHLRPKKKPRTVKEFERLIRQRIVPELGRIPVADVGRSHAADFHRSLSKTPTEANRSLNLLSTVLNYAERLGARPRSSNPCTDIARYQEQQRKRYLTPAELARFGQALSRAEQEGTEHPSALLALRLLLLTGCRRSEVLNLRWSEVDLGRRCFCLSDSKTGPKDVPLGAPAVALLEKAQRQAGNPYVCWGQKDGAPFVGIDKPWRRLRAKAELEDVRLHDLRHSFAGVAATGGESLLIIAALLGHRETRTTERYAHLSDDPIRSAVERTSGEIAGALEGNQAAEVVALREKARRG